MAKRRMFSSDIIDDERFLDMPLSAQALYLHLGIRADDDGFLKVNKRLLAYIGASEADKKTLVENGYILDIGGGLYLISEWLINNAIRRDRYTPTIYRAEKAQIQIDENGRYLLTTEPRPSDNQVTTEPRPSDNQVTTEPRPSDNQVTTEPRPSDNQVTTANKKAETERQPRGAEGKDSIGKYSIGKVSIDPQNDTTTTPNTPPEAAHDEPYNPENDPNTIKGKIKAIREEREKQKRFTPPTLEMVKAYCEERGNGIDPAQFLDYYTANGWTQGKGKPIKDWQACVRTWERNGYHGTGGTYNGTNGTPDGEQYTNYYPQYAGNDLDKLPPITSTDGEKLPFQ